MDNRSFPLTSVREFIDEAERRGCYTDGQAMNYRSSWGLFLTRAAEPAGIDPTTAVAEMLPRVAELFDVYGSNAKASANSISAYTARVNKLLKDFLEWNGGDFMRWKRELEKRPGSNGSAPRSRPKSSRRSEPATQQPPAAPPVDSGAPDHFVHTLFMPRDRKAELRLPKDVTADDLNAIWEQLAAMKGLLETQAKIRAGQTGGGKDA